MRQLSIASICVAVLLSACADMSSSPHGGYGGRDRYDRPGRVGPVQPNPGAIANPDPLARSMTYTCEDLTTITLTEGQRDARAMLNSGLELGLARRGGGLHFGAPPYEFQAAGGEGTWVNQGRVFRCRAK